MPTLSKEFRRQLERVVLAAREEAERGAAAALESFGVGEARKPAHLDKAGEDLRKKLRAHGRQVGDVRRPDESQQVEHLIHECAYEHWHRMVFARFLAENGFLIEPESGLDVDLDFCEERARETKSDKWEVAAGFAQRMLPAVFRPDDPVLRLRLPAEMRNRLTALLASLPRDVFLADDSLGWVYQFWQAKKKEEVNESGVKIGADELAPVTQLFTEDYMVEFLLHNTLGAWWAGRKLTTENAKHEEFKTEEDVRRFCAMSGVEWKYLRFVPPHPGPLPRGEGEFSADARMSGRASNSPCAGSVSPSPPSEGGEGRGEVGNSQHSTFNSQLRWRPAAGTFEGWPKTVKELRVLDPCMGSGHFLVFALVILVRMRMEEEGLSARDACVAVLRDNLFGLELDPRCTQIAAFNLALAAWKLGGHHAELPLNLACSGLGLHAKKEDWLKIVDAASSRIPSNGGQQKDQRQDAAATFAPINYFQPDEPVAHLMGNLPHWRQQGTTYFVTFRCADALPQEKLKQWQQELDQWLAAHPEPHDEATRQDFYERFPKRIQTWLDAGYGECVLRDPAIRQIVESAMRHFNGQRYRLQEFVVAANHVHALVTPLGEHLLSDILHSWKSFTSNQINKARGKSGTFWQKESFDHIVRSPASLAKFRKYILSHNEVAAGNVAAASSRSLEEEQRLEAAATMKLKAGMERLYQLFQKAPVLGSLINPRVLGGDLLMAEFHELQPLLAKALQRETGDEAHELAVTAQGVAKAAEILARQFTLVATNVPYLGRGKQDDVLKDYCERVHPEAKADLATCFVERCLGFCALGASTALVTPQNWWFLGSYKAVRENLLTRWSVDFIVTLGEEAWQSFGDRGPVAALMIAQITPPTDGHKMAALDAMPRRTITEKTVEMRQGELRLLTQSGQYGNPDHRIIVDAPISGPLLQARADSFQGVSPADFPHYGRSFWEVRIGKEWRFWQSTVEETMPYGGRSLVLWWNEDLLQAMEDGQAFLRGEKAWGKMGVACRQMRNLSCTIYTGDIFDTNAAVIVPFQQSLVPTLWAFCSSSEFRETIRRVDKKVNVTNASFVKIPFDLAHWQKVAAEKYPYGLPQPFSSDPTQWLFNGHPKGAGKAGKRDTSPQPSALSGEGVALHVAVARLLGYQWPRQAGSSFPDCPALNPDGLEKHADNDGVVCFPQLRDEPPAATRLRALLTDAYSAEWSHALERKLIADTGSDSDSLEEWLVTDFFAQHCDLFHNRPFVWHIWDGRKDGFNVLVNYHKLAQSSEVGIQKSEGKTATPHPGPLPDRGGEGEAHAGHRTLESLTYAYLGDWINRQRDAVKHGEAGAEDRLAAAQELQSELKKISAGEPPYDLFVRWKPLHQQPLGWQPDLNDGVRLNIRPFMAANLSRGKKGCGLFRAKPGSSVKWDKDRGKEPSRPVDDFPWFWMWDGQTVDFKGNGEFDGNRWNDCHYTTAFKRAARERKAKE